MQAVVLAGGLATRLGELASAAPKYLMTVADRPFASWQLERLTACGFDSVLLLIGHLGGQIEAAIGDGSDFGLRVRYVLDGDTPLGTGGALRQCVDQLADSFLLTYGDSYLPFDYAGPLRDLRAHPEALGTMAVYRNDGRFDRSNTRVRGDLVLSYQKTKASDSTTQQNGPGDIDYGAIALRREAVLRLDPGRSELSELQRRLAEEGLLRAYRAAERFYEIGSAAGLSELDGLLRSGQLDGLSPGGGAA